jgi:hypothetical protein
LRAAAYRLKLQWSASFKYKIPVGEGKVVELTAKMVRTSTFNYDGYYEDLKGTVY